MDVSQGLIAKLVKCKSIKHALTPISSQVSLLIIIVEQQEGALPGQTENDLLAGTSVLDVTACAAHLAEAVGHLVHAGERQSQASKDEDFIAQMSAACESLTVACDQLSILAQRFSSGHTPTRNSRDSLCQAAKDVLQGVLKVFLVIDDFHVGQILSKVDFVLRNVADVLRASKSDLVQVFKSLTFSVLALKTELKKRCSNLLSRACAEQILVWSGVLQNSVPSLSLATQTKLKYQDNLAAKASQESVEHEMQEACKKIRQLLLTGPQDEVEDELLSFVGLVDKVMDNLSVSNRSSPSPGLDMDIVALVQHSMGVAHLATGSHRDLVVTCCHRILQAKFRLFDLEASLRDGQWQNDIRVDYDNTCETLLDEVCDLEKQVNMTLLQLIIQTFLCPEEELRPLRNIARRRNVANQDEEKAEGNVQIINKFTEFSEGLCQVSLLVAASSTHAAKVTEIVSSVRSLESIEAEVGPAVLLTAADQSKASGNHQHLDLTLDRWLREVRAVLTAVDTMVDPRMFMDMTESIMERELEKLRDVVGRSREELCARFYHLRHLAQRPVQVARRLQDESSDAIYRNGLEVFIQLLVQRIAEATAAFQEVVTPPSGNGSSSAGSSTKIPPSPRQVDTLHRRLSLARKAVGTLREGLNIRHHPGLMSEHRMLFAHRPVEMVHEHIKLKKEKEENKTKAKEAKTEELKRRKKEEKKLEELTNGEEKEPAPAASTKVVSLPKPDSESVVHTLRFPPEFDDKEKEGGSAAEIYKLARRLASASFHQETRSVEELTHGVLSWTNHVVENAGLLLAHCPHIAKKDELKNLVKEVDRFAPSVIQQARFVCAGDTLSVYTLMTDVSRWASKLNSARVIVDVAADRWLVLTSDLRELTLGRDQHKLKLAVSAVVGAQKEMTALLLKTRFLTGSFVPDGHQKIQFLTESHAEIENLAVTIKTAVDVAGVSDSQHDHQTWWQLGISCRDWAVLMTCVAAVLDGIADTMGGLACLRMPRLAPLDVAADGGGLEMRGLRLADVVERETDSLLELVDCVVAGDETLKTRSESLVYELQAALTDIFSVARQPVTLNETPLHALLCRLRIGLAKSRWIERALELQDLVRNSCCQYMGFARTLLLDAQDLSIKEEAEGSVTVSEARHRVSKQFLEKSAALKQRTLRAMQLCPELSRRAVVRSTLDTVAKLTTEIGDTMRAPGRIPDAKVSSLTEQWGARLRKLLVNLAKMDGVKPQVIAEIEKFNKGGIADFSRPISSAYPSPQPVELPMSQRPGVDEPPHPVLYPPLQAQSRQNLQTSSPQRHQQGRPPPPFAGPAVSHQNADDGEGYLNDDNNSRGLTGQPWQKQQFQQQDQQRQQYSQPQQQHYQPQQQQQHQQGYPSQQEHQQAPYQPGFQEPQPWQHQQPYQQQPQQQYQQKQPYQLQPQQPYQQQPQQQYQQPYQQQPQQQYQQPYQQQPQQQYQQPYQQQLQQPYQQHPQQQYQEKQQQQQPYHHQQQLHQQRYPPPQQPQLYQPGVEQLQPRHQELWQQHNRPQAPQHPNEPGTSTANIETTNPAMHSGPESETPVAASNPVQMALRNAEDLGIHLRRWEGENVRHLRLVQVAMEMARLCSHMALYSRGQGNFKSSSEVVGAATKIVGLCREVQAFGEKLLELADQGRTRDHIQVCLNKIHGCSSQLHIIATAVNNSAASQEGDRILVRNASNVLTAVKQFLCTVESLAAAKGIPTTNMEAYYSASDPQSRQVLELLAALKAENSRYLAEDRNTSTKDILGLHRMELHRPPSLASLLDVDLDEDADVKKVKQSQASPKWSPTRAAQQSPSHLSKGKDSEPVKKQALPSDDGDVSGPSASKRVSDSTRQATKKPTLNLASNSDGETVAGKKLPPTNVTTGPEKQVSSAGSDRNHPVMQSGRKFEDTANATSGASAPAGEVEEVKEGLIEKVTSPTSDIDVDKLLFRLDEAIEGRWMKSPPPHSTHATPQTPASQAASNSQSLRKDAVNWKSQTEGQRAGMDKVAERVPAGSDNSQGNGDNTRPEKEKKAQTEEATQDSRKNIYKNNLDSEISHDPSKAKHRYCASKHYKAPAKPPSKSPGKLTNHREETAAQNNHNQSEEDWESVLGGASVDSFLLHPEDVFSEPTRGAVQYQGGPETPPLSLTPDPLQSRHHHDSSSEAGLVSAKSFLLSHEDVFSEGKDSWDTHF